MTQDEYIRLKIICANVHRFVEMAQQEMNDLRKHLSTLATKYDKPSKPRRR